MQEKLERIADLVAEGYVSGCYPDWTLNVEWEDDVTDLGLDIIASQIREGYESGYGFDEITGLISWEIEIDNSIDNDELEDDERDGFSYYDSKEDYFDSLD